MLDPARGEIWMVNFDPTKGHEQGGIRPSLVVSANPFNEGPAELVVVLPLTTKSRNIPLHIQLEPPEGGVTRTSFIKCDNIRTISKERLIRRLGPVSETTMSQVGTMLCILLDI